MITALTSREQQVLAHLAAGDSQLSVAGYLGISNKTVYTYVARIQNKLALNNARELWLYGILAGLAPIPERVKRLLSAHSTLGGAK